MGQKMACLGIRGAARSRQGESKARGRWSGVKMDVFGGQWGACRLVGWRWANFSVVVQMGLVAAGCWWLWVCRTNQAPPLL
jgi:hypothetical protein